MRELQQRSNVFEPALADACQHDLERWEANVRPGTVLNCRPDHRQARRPARRADEPRPPREAIERIQADLRDFRDTQQARSGRRRQRLLDRAAVRDWARCTQSLERLTPALERRQPPLPASSLYAWAALDLGLPYVNFTPSLGASFPAAAGTGRAAQDRRRRQGRQDRRDAA